MLSELKYDHEINIKNKNNTSCDPHSTIFPQSEGCGKPSQE